MGQQTDLPQLPKGWVSATLADLYKIVGGGTPSTKVESYWDGNIPWITSADIHGLKDIRPRRHITEEAIRNSATNLVPTGSLIVVTRVALGKVALTQMPICISQDSHALIGNESLISPDYSLYYLSQAVQTFKYHSRGTTIAGVTNKQLAELPLALPPFREQRRIVAKIEELFSDLDAGVAALQKTKAQLKRYRQAVLKAAVEGKLTVDWREANMDKIEPASALLDRIREERAKNGSVGAHGRAPLQDAAELGELPEGWWSAHFDEILVELKNGYFFSRAKTERSGVAILRISAVRPLSVRFDDLRYAPVDWDEVSQYQLQNGDLLFTRYNGSKDFVGACGLVRNLTGQLIYPDKLIRARVYIDHILPDYLELYFTSKVGRTIIERKAKTTAGQYGISGGDLKSVPVVIPSLAEQQQIVAEVERRLSVADEIEKVVEQSLRQAERLRQSILKRAFAGKLVPQDPSDEPAESLLERIKQERAKREGEGNVHKKIKKLSKSRQLDLI